MDRRPSRSRVAATTVGCLVVVLSLAGLVTSGAQAATPVATTSKMTTSAMRVAPEGSVTFKARTTSSSPDDTGHTVLLEGRPDASTAWQTLSRTTTTGDPRKDTDGFAGFVVRLQSDYQFRMTHPAQAVRGKQYGASRSQAFTIRYGAPRTFRTVDDGASRGRQYDLIPQDRVEYVVQECDSCGFTWRVEQAPAGAVVSKTGETTADQRAPGTAGGSRTRTYVLTAQGRGATSMVLAYTAPDGTVERRVRLALRVV